MKPNITRARNQLGSPGWVSHGVLVILAWLVLGHCIGHGASTATRSFSEAVYRPGAPLDITLQVTPESGAVALVVAEDLPPGWQLANLGSGAAYDAVNHQVKFGPLPASGPIVLRYRATPPLVVGSNVSFHGELSVDGVNQTVDGMREVEPGPLTSPPVIVIQPVSRTVPAGTSVGFNVSVTGATPLAFQWLKDGVPLANATNAALVLRVTSTTNAGAYALAVTNAAGATTSSNAVLVVTTGQPGGGGGETNDLSLGLEAWYQFEGNLQDSSPHARHAQAVNFTPIYESGPRGQGMKFTQASSQADHKFVNVPPWIPGGRSFSAAGWVRYDAINEFSAFIPGQVHNMTLYHTGFVGGEAVDVFALTLNRDVATGKVVARVVARPNGDGYYILDGADHVTLGKWHHLAAVVDRVQHKIELYLNGEFVNSIAIPSGATFEPSWSNIAGFANGLGGYNASHGGRHDDLRIYSRALTRGEISELAVPRQTLRLEAWYRLNGDVQDSSGQGRHGQVMGMTASYIDGAFGQALKFQGSAHNQVSLLPAWAPGSGSFSVAGWVRFASLNDFNSTFRNLIIFQSAAEDWSDGIQLGLTYDGNTGVVTSGSWMRAGKEAGDYYLNPTNRVTANRWHHLATTIDRVAGKYQLYLNGELIAERDLAGLGSINSTWSALGDYRNHDMAHAGSLDDVRIYSGALSSSDVRQLTLGGPEVPAIVSHPQGQSVVAGATLSLGVIVAGEPPFAYQWHKGAVPLAGETNANLIFSNIQLEQSGDYGVVITNSVSSITSSNATVAVLPRLAPPGLLISPVSQLKEAGQNATLSVIATGGEPLAYQWRRNGTNLVAEGGITNVNSATLFLPNLTTNHAGAYSVVVSNPAGSVISAPPAVLTVRRLPQTITFGPLHPRQFGEAPFALTATNSSGLPVQFVSSTPSVARVEQDIVTLASVGTTTITARHPGDAVFQPASAEGRLEVRPPTAAAVAGAWIFYNRSAFDGNDPAPNASDDNAMAIDKLPLFNGQLASFTNYTSYSRGINGVFVDVVNLAGTPTATDFAFRIGNKNATTEWVLAPPPASITVRPGAGVGGAARITLVWTDNVIQKTWLQVTLLASAATGLTAPYTFYFGNAVGDSGNVMTDANVTVADELLVRANPRTLLNPAPLTFRHDYNRDRRVDTSDRLITRNNRSTVFNALKLIRPDGTGGPVILVSQQGSGLSPLAKATVTRAGLHSWGEPQDDMLERPVGEGVSVSLLQLQVNDTGGEEQRLATFTAASSAGGRVTFSEGRFFYEPPPEPLPSDVLPGDDTFTYSVADVHGLVGHATVFVRELPPGISLVSLFQVKEVGLSGSGQPYVRFQGQPGRVYVLETAEALGSPIAWEPQGTLVADDNGVFEAPLPVSASESHRFFRAVIPK